MARTYRDRPAVKAQRRRRTCGDCGSTTCDWCLANRTISARRAEAFADVADWPDEHMQLGGWDRSGHYPDQQQQDVLAIHAPWADSALRAEADAQDDRIDADWDRRVAETQRDWARFEDERSWAWD